MSSDKNNNTQKGYQFVYDGRKYIVNNKLEESIIKNISNIRKAVEKHKNSKNIKKRNKKNIKGIKAFSKKNPKIPIIAATAIALGTGAIVIGTGTEKNDDYTIAMVNDIADDKYENSVPMKSSDGKITIEDNSIVVVKSDSIKNNNEVMYLDGSGNFINGKIQGKYLHECMQMNKEELMQYNSAFMISSDFYANITSKPTRTEKYNVSKANKGDIVLAGIPEISSSTQGLWYPILYADEQGFSKGYLNEKDLTLVDENVYENKKNKNNVDHVEEAIFVVDTSSAKNMPLNLREKANIYSNIIDNINDETEIRIPKTNVEDSVLKDGHEWVKVFINDKEGYVDKTYLKEKKKTQIQARVNDNYLQLKKDTKDDSEVLLNIPDGYIITLYEDEIENKNTGIINKKEWTKINVNGIEGYVDSNGIVSNEQINKDEIDINKVDEFGEEKTISYVKNNDGNVLIVDFNGGNVKIEDLEELLNNGINTDLINAGHNNIQVASSDIRGPISGVIIKIGATTTERDSINISTTFFDRDVVNFCEENHVPYGFYYFMGSETREESKAEYKYILDTINSFDSKEYNVLPFMLDVESGDDSRIKNDCTEAAIAITNGLKGNGQNVMLYTSGNSATGYGKIIDLEKYYMKTRVKDLWFVYPRGNEESHKKYIDDIPDCMNIVMKQELLDAKSIYGNINLSVISAPNFERIVTDTYENTKFSERENINTQTQEVSKKDIDIGER